MAFIMQFMHPTVHTRNNKFILVTVNLSRLVWL